MNGFWKNKWIQRGACALLCIGMLLAAFLADGGESLGPKAPQPGEQQSLELLTGGESAAQTTGTGGTSASDSAGPGSGGEGDDPAPDTPPDPDGTQDPAPVTPEPDNTQTPGDAPDPDSGDAPQPSASDAQDPGQTNGTAVGTDEPGSLDTPDDTGTQGGDDSTLDLGAVFTWQKYGREDSTVVCDPGGRVRRTVLWNQVPGGRLEYEVALFGDDAIYAELDSLRFSEGNGRAQELDPFGRVTLERREDGARNYTFTVTARVEKPGENGQSRTETVTFTFVIRYQDGLDLELELDWIRSGSLSTLTVAADGAARRTVLGSELTEGAFRYSFSLAGESATDAELLSAEYSADGGEGGALDTESGTLTLTPGADGTREYTLLITALVDDGGEERTVTFTVTLDYQAGVDLRLILTWQYRGVTPRTAECQPDSRAALTIKQNQLSRGELLYALDLEGESAPGARLLSASLEGPGGSQDLSDRGSATLSLPEGQTESAYVLRARALLEDTGREVSFTFRLTYTADAAMTMEYTLLTEGQSQTVTLSCENGRTVTAERIYSDQLTEDTLPVSFLLAGEGMTIERITLYQSGSGRERTLAQSPGSLWNGEALLLTDGEREGENRFTVSARDGEGTAYTFTFHLPFIRRGDKTIVIDTNLPEDRTIRNETDYDLRIRARTVETDGSVFAVIRANGVTLTLDGEKLEYTGASGEWLQYKLYAKNPPEGDDNTHVLVIHARDDYGNETTETIELLGQRTEDGQKIGTAHIYIDMSTLGLGTTSRIAYDVLSGEPISYVVAKAVWGYDAGEPYGTARETFGWDESDCSYGGKLDQGFYLAAMGDGSDLSTRAKALSGDWRDFGSTEEEILAAIDRRFGAGSGMAALWRCIYRNGIELRSWDDHHTVGEFDFTNGSGWLYQLDGEFYPGASMSDYTLQDGSVLVLRYTLAYGWDVSEGLDGNQGNTVGYCARAINGRIQVNHRVEDGVCVSCGLRMGDCTHDNAFYRDNGDGTCGLYCPDCGEYIQDLEPHDWAYSWEPGSEEHTMTCQNCGAVDTEEHEMYIVAGTDTATCTEPGTATFACDTCKMREERTTEPLRHATGGIWHPAAGGTEHFQTCKRCGEEIEGSRGTHEYRYDSTAKTWFCDVCDACHDDECGDGALEPVPDESSSTLRVYRCSHCGLTLEQEGDFTPEPDLPPPDPDPDPEGPEDPDASGGDPPEDGE